MVISDSESDPGSGSASTSASAEVQALFDDSDEELQKLQQYDTSCQNQRKKTKEAMTIQKAIAAREKAAKAKLTLEEQDKKATAKANAVKAAKAKSKSTKAKTGKAKSKSTKAKTGKAKTKSTKAKTKSTKAKTKSTSAKASKVNKANTKSATTLLSIGMKVNACWQGDDPDKGRWYNGKVVAVDHDAETAHVKFDDGDEDDSLSWSDIRIL